MGRGFHSYVSLLEGNYISWHTSIYIPICVGMILSQILYSVVSDINDINDIHTNGSLGYKWGYNDTKWDIYPHDTQ